MCHTDWTWIFYPTSLLSLWWHGTSSTGCLQPPPRKTSWEERSSLSENRVADQMYAQIFSAEMSHQMDKRFVIHLQEAENWHYLRWSASLTKLECMVLPVILLFHMQRAVCMWLLFNTLFVIFSEPDGLRILGFSDFQSLQHCREQWTGAKVGEDVNGLL